MMKLCSACPQKSNCTRPDGDENPDYLFVGEAPGETENDLGKPFVGKAGKFLRESLKNIGITSVRFGNAVICRPVDSNGYNRKPSSEEIKSCKFHLFDDIRRHKPKVIVCLGSSAVEAFFPDRARSSVTALMSTQLRWEGIPVFVNWHPSYLLRSGDFNSKDYPRWKDHFLRIKKLVEDLESGGESQDLGFKIKFYWPDQSEEFFAEFDGVPKGFDIEANQLENLNENFRWAGYSLAKGGLAGYMVFQDLFNPRNKLEGNDILACKHGQYLKEQQEYGLYVFNQSYERLAALRTMRVSLDKLKDVRMAGRALGLNGGLKAMCDLRLNKLRWNDVVETFLEEFTGILKFLKPRHMRDKEYYSPEYSLIRDRSYRGLIKSLSNQEELNKQRVTLLGRLKNVRDIVTNACNDRDQANKALTDLIRIKLDDKDYEAHHTDVPYQIEGLYCCQDSYNTVLLNDNCMGELKKRKCAKSFVYYNRQAFLASEFKLAGIRWDDKQANKLYEQYTGLAVECLRQLLLQDHAKKQLKLSNFDVIKIQSCTDLGELKMILNPLSSTTDKARVLSSVILTSRSRFCLVLNEIKRQVAFEAAQKENETYSDGLSKDRYHKGFNEPVSDRMPIFHKIWTQFITYLTDTKEVSKFNKSKLGKFDEIRNKLQSLPISEFSSEEQKLLRYYYRQEVRLKFSVGSARRSTHFRIKATDAIEVLVEDLFNSYIDFLGVDQDDKSTWTEEMHLLVNLRMFKKTMKIRSYINGRVGRAQVSVVNKKAFTIGKRVVLRKRQYWLKDKQPDPNEVLQDDEEYLYTPDLNPCSVTTLRWSGGLHTAPSGNDFRSCLTSRFKDGFILHHDVKQAELRMLGVMANDQKLLEAFRRGADIHRTSAAIVNDKLESEVSEAERREAKIINFALVYGKSLENFANEFLTGNVEKARGIFAKIFKQYSKLKEFIELKKQEVLSKHEITTFFDNPIPIEFNENDEADVASAIRRATNYGIQHAASNVVALTLWYMSEFMREYKFKTRMWCFSHDAGDDDTHPLEVLLCMWILPYFVEDWLNKKWHIPLKVDTELGFDGYHSVKLERRDHGNLPLVTLENGRKLVMDMDFEAQDSNLKEVVRRLELVCDTVKVEIKEEKSKLRTLSDAFALMRAFNVDIGKSVTIMKGRIIAQQSLSSIRHIPDLHEVIHHKFFQNYITHDKMAGKNVSIKLP